MIYPLVMTNIAMVFRWPIEIDGLPNLIAWWIFPVRKLWVILPDGNLILPSEKDMNMGSMGSTHLVMAAEEQSLAHPQCQGAHT